MISSVCSLYFVAFYLTSSIIRCIFHLSSKVRCIFSSEIYISVLSSLSLPHFDVLFSSVLCDSMNFSFCLLKTGTIFSFCSFAWSDHILATQTNLHNCRNYSTASDSYSVERWKVATHTELFLQIRRGLKSKCLYSSATLTDLTMEVLLNHRLQRCDTDLVCIKSLRQRTAISSL